MAMISLQVVMIKMVAAVDSSKASGEVALHNALRLLSSDGLGGAMMVVDQELAGDPESWEAWAAKADILYLQGDFVSAKSHSKRSIELNPDNALAWNTLGNSLYRLHQLEEAIDCYDRAIDLDPLLAKAWHNKKMALDIRLSRIRPRVSLPRASRGDGHRDGDGSLRLRVSKVR